MSETDWREVLREAAERRSLAAAKERQALDDLNRAVRSARADGFPAVLIAAAIGTTRQRVYEILREGTTDA